MQENDRHNLEQDPEHSVEDIVEGGTGQLERRKMIKAAIASVPIVLTITAGRARAQDTGSAEGLESAPVSGDELDNVDEDTLLPEDEKSEDDLSAVDSSGFSKEELQILNEATEETNVAE